jgi:hypothetical protein
MAAIGLRSIVVLSSFEVITVGEVTASSASGQIEMNRTHSRAVAVMIGFMLTSGAVACSYCAKDVLSASEFDQRSWEYAEHVFVALVTGAELIEEAHEIQYKVRADEVFKGNPNSVARIGSQRPINAWGDLQEMVCGEVIVSVGDRLIVFADGSGKVAIGRCSPTRVIEGSATPSDQQVQDTLRRLREWSEQMRRSRP